MIDEERVVVGGADLDNIPSGSLPARKDLTPSARPTKGTENENPQQLVNLSLF